MREAVDQLDMAATVPAFARLPRKVPDAGMDKARKP